jgi:hypothetical protein
MIVCHYADYGDLKHNRRQSLMMSHFRSFHRSFFKNFNMFFLKLYESSNLLNMKFEVFA